MTYGSGDKVTYSYDLFDRLATEQYTNSSGTVTSTHSYAYDGAGNLSEKSAATTGQAAERYAYQYDSLGRLHHSRAYFGGALTLATTQYYDTANRLKRQEWNVGANVSFTQKYTYSATDGTMTGLSVVASIPDGGHTASSPVATYTYNALRQITKKSFDYTGGEQFYHAFAYRTNTSTNRTTNQIEYTNYRLPNGTLLMGYKYGYDSSGRISSVTPSAAAGGVDSTKAVTYTYDTMGRLTASVDKSTGTTVNYGYTYDTAGNLRKATGSVTKTYTYGNSAWKDLLTSVQVGSTTKSITYPTSNGAVTAGTPLTWYNGSDYTFTWKQGTQLATAKKGSTTTTYTYDMDGVRTDKKVGSAAYHFDTMSGKVVHQTGAARELWFIYDENGQPYMMISKHGSTVWEYWFLLNAQGDVVGIINRYRQLVATYTYDPYGAITSEWEHPADTVGEINPIRYRGYFYDFETGFYYLQSRYYDPVIGRFISADSYATTDIDGLLSANMFSYCEGDPVNQLDSGGKIPAVVIGFLVGVAGQYTSDVIENVKSGKTGIEIFKPTSSVTDYLASGAGGAVAAIPGLSFAGTMLTGAAGNVITDYFKGNISNLTDFGKSAATGAAANGLGFLASNAIAGVKVGQVSNMGRAEKKIFLRDKVFQNQQRFVNQNLRVFNNNSFHANVKLFSSKLSYLKSGIYSTLTSTVTLLLM